MKLLGWMHRKFRQNSGDPLKDFVVGQPSLDDQQYLQKQNYGTRPFKQAPKDHCLRKSFTGQEAARVEDEDYEDESSAAMTELFHGFLAIGTLGTDQVSTDLSTPKFSISVDNITEKETEVTENDLKLINDELEKVLGAEAKDDGCNYSSGRNSHVSTGRSSHGSTITLSGKPIEGSETNANGTTVCPLQGYLFGSAIELSETTTTTAAAAAAAVPKKEHRTSLGELFQMSKTVEEMCGTKCDREERRTEKEADKSALHLMKKLLKKKMLHSSRSSTAAAGGSLDSASAETKLHKILQMFHRKVHPETSAATLKSTKTQKTENKKKILYNGDYSSGDQVPPDEDIISYSKRSLSKESMRRHKSQSNPLHFTLSSSDSNGNREHWIKTDADYLVLEL